MFFYSESDLNVPLTLSVNNSSLTFVNTYVDDINTNTFIVSASSGNTTETITLSDNTDQYSFSPSTFFLSSTGSQTITITFAPTSWGVKTGTVQVSASGGSIINVGLSAVCVANPLIITSSVGNISFGNGYVNETISSTFTVSAGGRVQDIVLMSDDSDQFDFSPSSFSMTGANQTQVVTVYFTPTSDGSKLGLLTLSASGGDVAHVSLTGSAIYRPLVLTSSVNSITFANTDVNSISSQTFTVSAGGFSSVEETVTISDDSNQFDFSPSSFALTGSGTSQTITVNFIPTSLGVKTANLNLISSGGSTKLITLQGTCADQYSSNVSLLLKGEGPNNSTSIVDSSNNNFAVSTAGNAKISTTKFKYGASSISFDGFGDYLSTSNTKFKLSDSYTVEFWINPNSYGVPTHGAGIFFNGTISSDSNRVQLAITPTGAISTNGITTSQVWGILTSAATVPLNTWTHIALSSTGTTVRLFVNGVLVGSSAISLISTLPNTFYIGFHRSGSALRYFNGYIDDFRLTQGVARYTANFTPPTAI